MTRIMAVLPKFPRLIINHGHPSIDRSLISSDHNSSVILDLAMGQIPRSTKRISSLGLLNKSLVGAVNK